MARRFDIPADRVQTDARSFFVHEDRWRLPDPCSGGCGEVRLDTFYMSLFVEALSELLDIQTDRCGVVEGAFP